jgi:excisionase family DNA binding protein
MLGGMIMEVYPIKFKQLYTLKEAGKILRLCVPSLRELVISKEIESYKIGRAYLIDEDAIRSYMIKCRTDKGESENVFI